MSVDGPTTPLQLTQLKAAILAVRHSAQGALPAAGRRTILTPDTTPQHPPTPMPRRAAGVTSQFLIDGVSGRLATAATPGGELTHVELRIGKHGGTLAGLTDALSTAITTALHAGAPTATFIDALRHTRYDPAGTTNDPDLPYATSLGDYLAQRLHHNHPDPAQRP